MTAALPPLLALEGVCFRYPDGSTGLDHCSFTIARGSRTALLGMNGAGKTTAFLHLNGILRPRAGQVRYDGMPLDYSRRGLQTLRSRVGLVFQNPDSQLFSASVQEDISFGPMNLGLPEELVRLRVAESLQAVGLTDCAEKPVHNLSFGQKKRVCIAGLLAMQPEVIILDEPMAGLDQPMQTELEAILDRLHADGITIIIATHDIDFAYRWSDRMLLLAGGRCAAALATAQLTGSLQELAAIGVRTPAVLELYQTLLEQQLMAANGPPPRTTGELAAAIKNKHLHTTR